MAQDTKVSDLIINKGLTVEELNEKYAQGLIGDNELAIVDAEETVVQTDTMPVASAEEFGSIVQYAGADTQDYTNGYFYKCTSETTQASATISTTSPNLYDLAVDLDTFVAEEQPTGSETVEFVRGLVNEHQEIEAFGGVSATISDPALLKSSWIDLDPENRVSCSFDYNNAADDLWTVTPQSGNTYYWHTSEFASHGITVTGTPVEGNSYIGYWTAGDWAWKKNDTAVNIADYGITYQGYDEESGVTITVAYTAGVTTYSWENIEVQPSYGGGITWVASLDLPLNAASQRAVLKLGDLPDGKYEFYICANQCSNTSGDYVPTIYKVRLKLDRTHSTTCLIVNPVLGEGYLSGSTMDVLKYGQWRSQSLGYETSEPGVLYLMPSGYGFLQTDINDNYMTSADDGIGCFKATAIKNITTGDEYVPELEFHSYSVPYSYITSRMFCASIISQESYSNVAQSGWYIDQANYIGFVLSCAWASMSGGLEYQTTVDVSLTCDNDYFVFRVDFLPFDKLRATVIKRTAGFDGVQLGTSSDFDNAIAIKFPSTFVDKNVNYTCGLGTFSTSWHPDVWGLTPSIPFTEIGTLNVGSIIDLNNYGEIVQYDGTTNANYTNGYFYKATGTLVDVPGSIDCIEQNQDPNITISMDVDGFITAYEAIYGAQGSDFWPNALDTNSWGWWWQYDMSNNLIYWDNIGWLDASLTQYFTISTTQNFTFGTYNYVPKAQEIQGGAWTRTDVQPAPVIPDPLPSQTGNAGKFLMTDGTNASWGNALVNKAVNSSSMVINEGTDTGSGTDGVVLGKSAYASGNGGVSIGANSSTSGGKSIAIGRKATASARCAIQLGYNATNSDVDTFKVANGNGNFEMMSANGTIPTDRFTTTPVADGTYVPTLTISSGTATRTWGAAPSGGSAPTLTWYTVSSAGSTLTIADTSSANLVKIYKNGLLLEPTADYSISGTTLTMVTALVVGDKITTEAF